MFEATGWLLGKGADVNAVSIDEGSKLKKWSWMRSRNSRLAFELSSDAAGRGSRWYWMAGARGQRARCCAAWTQPELAIAD